MEMKEYYDGNEVYLYVYSGMLRVYGNLRTLMFNGDVLARVVWDEGYGRIFAYAYPSSNGRERNYYWDYTGLTVRPAIWISADAATE